MGPVPEMVSEVFSKETNPGFFGQLFGGNSGNPDLQVLLEK